MVNFVLKNKEYECGYIIQNRIYINVTLTFFICANVCTCGILRHKNSLGALYSVISMSENTVEEPQSRGWPVSAFHKLKTILAKQRIIERFFCVQ